MREPLSDDDDPQHFLQHRSAIVRRLEWLNRALTDVDKYEANQHLPRPELEELHAPLVEELAQLGR